MTRKVWVEVEVQNSRPGESTPRLVGGLDPDGARQALLDLIAFKPGCAPEELFNEDNELYSGRRSLAVVLESDLGQDCISIEKMLKDRDYALAEKRAVGLTDEELRTRYDETRDAYIARRYSQIDARVERVLYETSDQAQKDTYVDIVAEHLGRPAADLRARMQGDEDAPFFTEAYLYPLLGKDSARSILARLERLSESLGLARVYEAKLEPCPTCGHVLT